MELGLIRLRPTGFAPGQKQTVPVEICPDCTEDMAEKIIRKGNVSKPSLKKMVCTGCGYSYPILTSEERWSANKIKPDGGERV